MGKLLSGYKQSIADGLINNIAANTIVLYAFASNPVGHTGNTSTITRDDYSTLFFSSWQMLFGKRIANTDIQVMIRNTPWTANTIYTRYDNTSNTLYDSNFYVVCHPGTEGGYDIYKCIDNANGAPSTVKPDVIQPTTFQKSDGYMWRYITTISGADYTKFATDQYIPVYANSVIQTGSLNYNGVDVVVISNTGNGYIAYANGIIQSVVNSTVIEISSGSSVENNFYTRNGIYISDNISATAELLVINSYAVNSTGNWVYLNAPANTNNIIAGRTQYLISPYVSFETDATFKPVAYSIINTFAYSVEQIVVVDSGYGITWANVVLQSNTSYGSGANLYAIVPPPGGHGYQPKRELDTIGFGISFSFANTENDKIVTQTKYDKIGILKNPYVLNSNTTKGGLFTNTVFSQVLRANVSSSPVFANGDTIVGLTSNARGIVVFSNSTSLYLTGDKYFQTGETVRSSNSGSTTTITIATLGDLYVREDLEIVYIQNIDNVTRSNTQTESFKLIIQI